MLNLLIQLRIIPSYVKGFLQSQIEPAGAMVNYAESLKISFIIVIYIFPEMQINCRWFLFLIEMFMRTHFDVSGSFTNVPGITARTSVFVNNVRSMFYRNRVLRGKVTTQFK